jgi:multidrug efflux pump subunit AcrB
LQVNHQGVFPAVTITFNLDPSIPLGDAVAAIRNVERTVGLPSNIRAGFQGTAQAFQDSLSTEPLLILAALATVYMKTMCIRSRFSPPFRPLAWERCSLSWSPTASSISLP